MSTRADETAIEAARDRKTLTFLSDSRRPRCFRANRAGGSMTVKRSVTFPVTLAGLVAGLASVWGCGTDKPLASETRDSAAIGGSGGVAGSTDGGASGAAVAGSDAGDGPGGQTDALDASAANAEAGACPSGGWCSSSPQPGVIDLNGVWGSGPDDVWAVGAGGVIDHWNGSAWSIVDSATTQGLVGVWGSGPDDVWAVGTGGVIDHWNGTVWSPSATASGVGTSNLLGVWGSGPDDVWAVGQGSLILHWAGTVWSVARDAVGLAVLVGVWGSGPSDVWAVGADAFGDPLVLRWDGAAWSTDTAASKLGLLEFDQVWGSGPNDVWAVGMGNGVCFGCSQVIVHWNGTAWSTATPKTYDLHGIWGRGANDVWAVGEEGTIVHWDGTAWSTPEITADTTLSSVWGSGPNDVWAVGLGPVPSVGGVPGPGGGLVLHHGP
jgi:hypothetical protein